MHLPTAPAGGAGSHAARVSGRGERAGEFATSIRRERGVLPWGITDRMTRLLAVVLELEQMFSLSLPAAERWMDAGVFVRVLDLALRESVSHVHRGLALGTDTAQSKLS